MYRTVLRRFTESLRQGPPDWQERRAFLDRQHKFVDRLVALVKAVARENVNRKKKIEKLQSLLADSEAFKFNFQRFDPLPFPLDPETKICGLVVDKANLFKSSLMPARLTFITDKGTRCQKKFLFPFFQLSLVSILFFNCPWPVVFFFNCPWFLVEMNRKAIPFYGFEQFLMDQGLRS
jgi:hypothetical protein